MLKFQRLQWPKGEPEKAVYLCEHCDGAIENFHKTNMLERGEWRASSANDGKTVGFHLSSLYSPVGWFSWGQAARMFEEAQKSPELLQVFVNTVLGETWVEQGEAPDWRRLYDRREDYRIGVVPAGGLFLTAGADVQKDRIEVEIVAWGRGKESWSVDYRVLKGDTSRQPVWGELTKLAGETFRTHPGVDLPVVKLAIDSGYAPTEVYGWVKQQSPGRVVVVKGDSRAPALVGLPSSVEVGPHGKRIQRGVRIWPVNSGMAKQELYRWLRLERPTEESGEPFPAGYCHFPRYNEEFFKQLTAEQLVTRVVNGYPKPEWQKTRERNEALDARVYAMAAAVIHGIERIPEKKWAEMEEALRPPQAGEPSPRKKAIFQPVVSGDPYL